MTGVAVPVDVAELVVRSLRPLLAARDDEVADGARVSTETGRGANGGPPSLPWLLVAEDGHTWSWPALQRAVIRMTCWHHTPYSSKALAGLALGLLCASGRSGLLVSADPVSGPLAGTDPYTDAPLATCAAVVYARTPAHP